MLRVRTENSEWDLYLDWPMVPGSHRSPDVSGMMQHLFGQTLIQKL